MIIKEKIIFETIIMFLRVLKTPNATLSYHFYNVIKVVNPHASDF